MTSIAGRAHLQASSTSASPPPHQPQKRIRRLPPEKRQKVSTACDSCKRRKFKCTGSNPCDLCVRKGYECTYTVIDKRSLKSERLFRLREEKRLREEARGLLGPQFGSDINKGTNFLQPGASIQQAEFVPPPQQQQQQQQQLYHPHQVLQNPPPPPHIPAPRVYQQQPYPKQQITPPDAPPYQSPQSQTQAYQQPSQQSFQQQPPSQFHQIPQGYQAAPPPPPQSQYPSYQPYQRLSIPVSPRYSSKLYPRQGQQSNAADSRPVSLSGPPSYNQGPFYGSPSGHSPMGPPEASLPPPYSQAAPQRAPQSPFPAPQCQPQIPQHFQPQPHINSSHDQYGTQQSSQYQHGHPLPPPQSKPYKSEAAEPHLQEEQKPNVLQSQQSFSFTKKGPEPSSQSASIPTPDSPISNTSEKTRAGSLPKFLQPLLSFPSMMSEKELNNGFSESENGVDISSLKTGPSRRGTKKEKSSTASKLQKQVDSNAIIDEEIANEMAGDVDSSDPKDGVSNQAGKSCILLNDKSGTFRYMGETSPLSVLYETRNIFYQYVKKTKLTEDLRGCPVVDKPLKVTAEVVVSLPLPEERNIYIEQFKRNINDTFFIYDLDKFYTEIVDPVYVDPVSAENETKLVQLYFVLAIGATYLSFSNKEPHATLGAKYFESGLLIQNSLSEDSEMWCVIAHYLQFHYYQSILKKSTAWIHLNLAIKFAQSLGLHRNFVNEQFSKFTDECEYRKRIFRSLYSSDRISSVFIGRPLAINDYDWDDPTRYESSKTLISSSLNFNAKCQIELARISHLIGKIVANFYQNRIIDINRTKNLAVQLKLWSKNLDPSLSVENLFKPNGIPHNEDGGNTQIVLMMHLLQLFAIMLLCRPFFMYDAVSHVNTAFPKTTTLKDKFSSRQFIQAATKASILAVKLMNHFINTSFREVKRMECYIIITCCFYSSIFIGISILNGNYQFDVDEADEEEQGSYTETEMMNLLRSAVYILNHYSTCNKGAERYAEIGTDLIDALANRHKTKQSSSSSTVRTANTHSDDGNESLLDADEVFNYFNFTDVANAQDLQNLIDFQQFFVSSDITNASVSDSSNMPYDYGNYDLFFGDKY
ncbi:Fgr27 protein [Candida orthopsilosis Co 90-125]|uniref:Fgr27 protein n=1 Tax=Candida orthopsilosis (strain 90-125) TaxID=1136231 RepID=H8X7Y7_CANO9|nr:Fgr27 protein [Candida orthopsilosis Co 90-125]CCG24086.1 Fgr27 protein [Candida orthopsilosis Co 90-125]